MNTQNPKCRKGIPWWVHVLLAIVFYLGSKYIVPAIADDATSRAQLTEAGNLAAPIIAIVFLLLAANGLFKDAPLPPSQEDPPDADGENGKAE